MKKRRLTLHGLVALLLGVAVLIIYLIGRRARSTRRMPWSLMFPTARIRRGLSLSKGISSAALNPRTVALGAARRH